MLSATIPGEFGWWLPRFKTSSNPTFQHDPLSILNFVGVHLPAREEHFTMQMYGKTVTV